jgi:uncharacterized protein YciI
MLFSVHAIDAADGAAKRQKVAADHGAHLKKAAEFGVTVMVGGPLVSDDGKGPVGSLMLVEGPDRATVEKFNNADPFFKNGVWDKIEIRRFDKRTG